MKKENNNYMGISGLKEKEMEEIIEFNKKFNPMKKENKKGESWRKGYQQGISDYKKELKEKIEKETSKLWKENSPHFNDEVSGYKDALVFILNLLEERSET